MRIVGLDRLKFNEAVAAGHYPCAPQTPKGSSRIFGEDDLIALYVFARLTEMDMLPRRAGALACDFASKVKMSPKEDRIIFARSINGGAVFFRGSEYDPDHAKKGRVYDPPGEIAYTLDFHVRNIRKLIRDVLEKEHSILGGDE
jgi:hypothetical protein